MHVTCPFSLLRPLLRPRFLPPAYVRARAVALTFPLSLRSLDSRDLGASRRDKLSGTWDLGLVGGRRMRVGLGVCRVPVVWGGKGREWRSWGKVGGKRIARLVECVSICGGTQYISGHSVLLFD